MQKCRNYKVHVSQVLLFISPSPFGRGFLLNPSPFGRGKVRAF